MNKIVSWYLFGVLGHWQICFGEYTLQMLWLWKPVCGIFQCFLLFIWLHSCKTRDIYDGSLDG